MNRSTFFKSLVGLAITPFVVKEIVEAKPTKPAIKADKFNRVYYDKSPYQDVFDKLTKTDKEQYMDDLFMYGQAGIFIPECRVASPDEIYNIQIRYK